MADLENETEGKKKQFALRISKELYDSLMAWANDDFRSLNGQIEYLLTECEKKRRQPDKK
ncbi:PTS ascorbate transporter subunit IIC [Clostridia bacterium]|nr:PTS ascorbate transporter subunit IIC [Clostridia bacterium]